MKSPALRMCPRRPTVPRVLFESLEGRRLLATVNWDGGGDGVTLTQAANWESDVLPGAADDAVINVAGAPTLTHNASLTVHSLTCAESLTMGMNATLTLGAASSFSGTLTLGLFSTLGGAGDIAITGTLTWPPSTISGTGTLTIAPGAVLNQSGMGVLGRPLTNAGTVNVAGNINLTNAAITNDGVFNLAPGSSASVVGGGGATPFNNAGTLNKDGAAQFSFLGSSSPVPLVNTGTVNVNAGTLQLAVTGSSNAGTIDVDSGATLSIESAGMTHGAGSVISGAGAVQFKSPQTIGGGATFAGSNMTLDFNGSLAGGADVTITGTLHWTGGTMSGAGSTIVALGGTLNITGGVTLSRTLIDDGTINHSAGSLALNGGTLVTQPLRKYHFSGTASIDASGGTNLITNSGVFNKQTTGTSLIAIRFDNAGTVNVLSGTLRLDGDGTNTGKRNIAAGATLHYFGDHTHGAGSTLAGGGTTIWQGGTHTISGDWTTAGYLTWTNITVDGPGTLSTTGPISWASGTVEGAGGLEVKPGGKITITTVGAHTLARSIANDGTLIWNNGDLAFGGATITNNAGRIFYVLSGATATVIGGANAVTNQGTIRKQLGTALSFGDVPLDSPGAIDIRNGSITIPPAALAQLSGTTLTGGDWSVLPTGDLFITGASIGTLGAGASVTLLGNAATFDALDGLETNDGELVIGGGRLFTISPAGGVFTNNGVLVCRKGSALRVEGDFVQSSAGSLRIQIASAGGAGVGRVLASGSAMISGAVAFEFVAGFTPGAGVPFNFVLANLRAGTFATATIPAFTGLLGGLVYYASGAQIRYTQG